MWKEAKHMQAEMKDAIAQAAMLMYGKEASNRKQ